MSNLHDSEADCKQKRGHVILGVCRDLLKDRVSFLHFRRHVIEACFDRLVSVWMRLAIFAIEPGSRHIDHSSSGHSTEDAAQDALGGAVGNVMDSALRIEYVKVLSNVAIGKQGKILSHE